MRSAFSQCDNSKFNTENYSALSSSPGWGFPKTQSHKDTHTKTHTQTHTHTHTHTHARARARAHSIKKAAMFKLKLKIAQWK